MSSRDSRERFEVSGRKKYTLGLDVSKLRNRGTVLGHKSEQNSDGTLPGYFQTLSYDSSVEEIVKHTRPILSKL